MSEHDEQKTFFDVLRLNESRHPVLRWIYAVPNGGQRNPGVAGKLRAEGVKAGIFDVHIPIPQPGWSGAWIEFKFGKNKLTPTQEKFLEHLMAFRYQYAVVRSCDEGIDFVERYLQIELIK
jgi:hypothetical protein